MASTSAPEERRLSILLQVAERLNRTLEIEPMLHAVLDLLCELLGVDSGWVGIEDSSKHFRLLAATGLPPALESEDRAALRWQPCFCQRCLCAGSLEGAVNVVQCERLATANGDHGGLRYHASVPLCLPDGREGLMNLAFGGDRTFSAEELALLTLVGATLSAAIHRAELYQAARASEEGTRRRMTAILESTSDLVAIADAEGRLMYLNLAGRRMLGIDDRADVAAIGLAHLLPAHAARPGSERSPRASVTADVWNGETTLKDRDGRDRAVSLVEITHARPDGSIDFLSVIARDISDRKRLEDELVRLADRDTLTGLFNRRRLELDLAAELGGIGQGARGALLFVDLDCFKLVNDSLGHRAGDALLSSVAALLQERIGSRATIARMGGDEFAVLAPHVDVEGAKTIADRILECLRSHSVVVAGQPVGVGASIGIALYPHHGVTAETLLRQADLAMYQAKEGRNRAHVYSPSGQRLHLATRLVWEDRVRQALTNDSLRLYGQPILDLRRGRVDRYEVLLRIAGEGGRVYAPADFLQAAEQMGLIDSIDLWVTLRAIDILAGARIAGHSLSLNVNLSGRTVLDLTFVNKVRHALAAAAVPPERLTFELTETVAIRDVSRAAEFIGVLKDLGCRFAVDDFGVGFSCFNHLKRLPVDYLKIDGSFVKGLARNPVDQALIQAMVKAAQGLGMETVGEFVDSGQTLNLLRTYGIDYGQGYYIGRPRPVARILPRPRPISVQP